MNTNQSSLDFLESDIIFPSDSSTPKLSMDPSKKIPEFSTEEWTDIYSAYDKEMARRVRATQWWEGEVISDRDYEEDRTLVYKIISKICQDEQQRMEEAFSLEDEIIKLSENNPRRRSISSCSENSGCFSLFSFEPEGLELSRNTSNDAETNFFVPGKQDQPVEKRVTNEKRWSSPTLVKKPGSSKAMPKSRLFSIFRKLARVK